jgi:hypothetical protein
MRQMVEAAAGDALDLRQGRPNARAEDASSFDKETRMASIRHIPADPTQRSATDPQEGPNAFVDAFFAAQRAQWEALRSWQESLATFGKDFWEQWAVRYAGGVPIDG